MTAIILALDSALIAIALVLIWLLKKSTTECISGAIKPIDEKLELVRSGIEGRLSRESADSAARLERSTGELRQQLSDRLDGMFRLIKDTLENQLAAGRAEQGGTLRTTTDGLEAKFASLQEVIQKRLEFSSSDLNQSLVHLRKEQADRLDNTTIALRAEFAKLGSETRASLDAIRTQVGEHLVKVIEQVNQRLDQNSASLKLASDTMRGEQAQRLDSAIVRLEEKFTSLQNGTEGRLLNLGDKLAGAQASARQELVDSLQKTSNTLKGEFGVLTQQLRDGLEGIRGEVDSKLLSITDRVTNKLDQNIKEGFEQFEKVQRHLQAAQEELKNVALLGNSVTELNNLLKLPHLRGRFGEAGLERLLADFLPAHMYEIQGAAGENGSGRADVVIKFPERHLPIDAKFPREQILPLFENSDPTTLASARQDFCRVMKEQARRIATYIRPENGTTDMALMYLPSETLYMEAVLNGELCEWLNKQKVYPVSPNTLIVMLQSIQMVFKMYEFAKGYERATLELKKAQTAFGHFEGRFEELGKSLGKAQDAYEVARGHLTRYRNRVTNLAASDTSEQPILNNSLPS